MNMSKNVTRLFDQFNPENYQLNIKLDKDKKSFSGQVIIRGQKVGRPSQRFTFHQKDLKIEKATATRHDKTGDHDIKLARLNLHKKLDEVRLHTDALIYPGQYTVTLMFSGQITDNLQGLYPSNFKLGGQTDVILGTQFESHYAREVFPCIDEPEAKATFDVTVTAPKNEVVLGNTPARTEKIQGQDKTVTFEQTPIMSTYLLAFVAGNLEFHEAKTKDGVTIRAYATPDKVKHVDFSLDVAVKVLEFYNDYFGIPYPLPKLDMVALPDFSMGAMENWGLVTYREQAILVDPDNTSLPSKQWVAMVIAHELAHQWFGNLVTMRWWTDLWLNEGFASWIEYMAVDRIFPEWQMWTQFIAEEQQAALRLDALENTHPIEVPVHHPDEIRTIFDTISYSKGSSIIHMLNDYLGPDIFREGLRHYLQKHAYKNTDTVDLWEALSEKSGKDVKAFMHNWTSEPGFPIVKASFTSIGKGQTPGRRFTQAEISQQRFYLSPPAKPSEVVWRVPLIGRHGLRDGLLDSRTKSFDLGAPDGDYYLNVNRSGFYRVAYDQDSLHRLSALVKAGKLPAADRLGLLSDSFEAAKAGHSDTVSCLELLDSYLEEDNAAVWDIMAMAIGDLRSVMGSDEQLREAMKPYIRQLVAKQLKRLGWEAGKREAHFDTLLRPTILGLAAFADEPTVLDEISRRYKNMKQPADITPDLRSVIWNTIARFGGQEEFNHFLKLHNQSTNGELRTTLAGALTGFKDPALTAQALKLVKTYDVRKQDAAYWLAYALGNRFGRDTAWQWMKDNWQWLEDNLGTDLSFSRFPVFAARVFTGQDYLDDFKRFFEPKSSPTLERAIKQGIEIINWHTAWYDRDHDAVLSFFKRH